MDIYYALITDPSFKYILTQFTLDISFSLTELNNILQISKSITFFYELDYRKDKQDLGNTDMTYTTHQLRKKYNIMARRIVKQNNNKQLHKTLRRKINTDKC